jgi:transcriptional regulator with XRE-family HTH domain
MTPRHREPWTPWTAATAEAIKSAPTIRALARATGISHAELARIAAGERNATVRVARRVATALGRLAAAQRRGATVCERKAVLLRRAVERASQ